MNTSEVARFLHDRVEVFRDYPPSRLDEVLGGAQVTTFEANEAIIEFGEEGLFLGVLLDGQARVSVTDDSGQVHAIGALAAGDVFGEMALMTGNKSMANVIAVTRVRALLIPRNLFATTVMTHPPSILSLSKTITERLKSIAFDERGPALAAAAFRRNADPFGLALKTPEPMTILVINCGSSSLKYNLFNTADEALNAHGAVERIGGEGTRQTHRTVRGETARDLPGAGHGEALAAMLESLTAPGTGILASTQDVSAIGHRVVHGGGRFEAAAVVDEAVLEEIGQLASLAPLHNPINLLGIREAMRLFPGVPQVAVFDTAFHHTLPPYAYLYGLPFELYERRQIRRYGFHGTSHKYVALRAAEFLKQPFNALEMITCHLGSGASVCAVDHGRSIDTSMGFTPAEGLVMGTRAGSFDPAILLHLMRDANLSREDLDRLINKESGLKGLSGLSGDMRDVERAAGEGHHRALLAFKTFCYQVRKTIGAYVAAMGGLDVLVFTGGIGQGSAGVRTLACQGLAAMGIRIDEARNREARGFAEVCRISPDDAPVAVLIVPTDEERMIARETVRALSRERITATVIRRQSAVPIPIEVSAHHVHLTTEHVEVLFGPGHALTRESDLSQPGQFACAETVALVGPKGRVERVRVLGPARKGTQVEIAMTEQFKLGIHPPVRESGDLNGTPGLTIEGPAGRVRIEQGVICAMRHIHMAPADALRFGVRDKTLVRVRVDGDRELIFGDVLIRVSPDYRLAMHIDTDEANAANVQPNAVGFIESLQSRNQN